MHSDLTTRIQMLKKFNPSCKSVISATTGAAADITVRHGDMIHFGNQKLEVRSTPGHTKGEPNLHFYF